MVAIPFLGVGCDLGLGEVPDDLAKGFVIGGQSE